MPNAATATSPIGSSWPAPAPAGTADSHPDTVQVEVGIIGAGIHGAALAR